jgi:orotidine-5'-phosphate decarboxylase
LDLKFHDIPNTVAQGVIQATKLGVEFVTVHLSGGKHMLDEIEVRLKEAELHGEIKTRPKILGVSVLSSFKEEAWVATMTNMAKISGIRPIEDAVAHFANLAATHASVFGMVCSPHEVDMVRVQHQNLFLMVPGIRMGDEANQDQARVMGPRDAKRAGASAIVVGRPITQSADPVTAVRTYLAELQS